MSDAKVVVTMRLRPEILARIPGKGGREAFLEAAVQRALDGEVKDFVPKARFLEWVDRAEKLARIVSADYASPAQKYLADGTIREAKAEKGQQNANGNA